MPADEKDQGYQWGRHAAKYDQLFLDPFLPGVESPLLTALKTIADPGAKTVADLGCGTGPLLPHLVGRFGAVIALDFAPEMVARARERLGPDAEKVRFEIRPMADLDDLAGRLDVACAVNSLVMPDIREIDRTLAAIRAALRPGGRFFGVVPSLDAICYQTMLLLDQGLERGLSPEEAERHAASYAEHRHYNFAFGRFRFRGLRQKFWQPFELRHRLAKAGFQSIELGQVLYPWDENMAGGAAFSDHPRSWDWFFQAEA